MLCLVTLKDGVIVILMASTCHSHKTALRIERVLQMTTPFGREASERHRALDAIQGPDQEKPNAQTPSLKSPQNEPWPVT